MYAKLCKGITADRSLVLIFLCMKKFIVFMFFAIASISSFAQDFLVDGLGYSVIREGDSYFDNTDQMEGWYDGKCVALTAIENSTDGRDLYIPNEVVFEGNTYQVKAIAFPAFKDAKLGTVTIANRVIGMFFSNAKIRKLVLEDGKEIVGTSYKDYAEDEQGLTLFGASIENIYFGRAVSTDIFSNNCIFVNAGVKSMTLGKNLDRIPWNFLCGNPIEKIVLPSNILTILFAAFKDCTQLKSVVIDSLEGPIFDEAFAGCVNLEDVKIKKCTDIGCKAFAGCSSLEQIEIPSGIISIGDSAFANCSNLKEVSLPNSLNRLGGNFNLFLGYEELIGNAFAGCLSLQKVKVNAPNPIINIPSNFEESVYSQASLCVPVGCKSVYEKADGWKTFAHIEEVDMKKDSLCSLLIIGCGNDSWTGYSHIDATIDDEKIGNSGGSYYYRNLGDVVSLKFLLDYDADSDNTLWDLDSVFVNGINVTDQLQDNVLTLKVDGSMTIDVTHKLHYEDAAVNSVSKDEIRMLVNGRSVEIVNAQVGDNIHVFDMLGRKIIDANVKGNNEHVLLPSNGIYIIQVGDTRRKIMIK